MCPPIRKEGRREGGKEGGIDREMGEKEGGKDRWRDGREGIRVVKGGMKERRIGRDVKKRIKREKGRKDKKSLWVKKKGKK